MNCSTHITATAHISKMLCLLQDAVSQVQQAVAIKDSHDRRGNLKLGNLYKYVSSFFQYVK